MPTEHIIALLVVERDKLNRAIEVLQGPIIGAVALRRILSLLRLHLTVSRRYLSL
jgi:hypothetical protein